MFDFDDNDSSGNDTAKLPTCKTCRRFLMAVEVQTYGNMCVDCFNSLNDEQARHLKKAVDKKLAAPSDPETLKVDVSFRDELNRKIREAGHGRD